MRNSIALLLLAYLAASGCESLAGVPVTSHRGFNREDWRSGSWRFGDHKGRSGWWYIVGRNWYPYEAPIHPYPDIFTPPGEEPGSIYWCPMYMDSYPNVILCPGGWQRIPERE